MHTLKSQKSFLNENSSCRDRTLKNQPKHDVATKSWSYMIESDGTGKHTCTTCCLMLDSWCHSCHFHEIWWFSNWALSVDCCVTGPNSLGETWSPLLCSVFRLELALESSLEMFVNKISTSSHLVSVHSVIFCSHSVLFPAFPVSIFTILNHPCDIFMKLWSHKFTPAVITTTPGMVLGNTTVAP